jgi:hypothetical protein
MTKTILLVAVLALAGCGGSEEAACRRAAIYPCTVAGSETECTFACPGATRYAGEGWMLSGACWEVDCSPVPGFTDHPCGEPAVTTRCRFRTPSVGGAY